MLHTTRTMMYFHVEEKYFRGTVRSFDLKPGVTDTRKHTKTIFCTLPTEAWKKKFLPSIIPFQEGTICTLTAPKRFIRFIKF